MEKSIIYIKENKKSGAWQYIKMITNCNGITLYSYYDGIQDDAKKSSFNKCSFIEYLKSIKISNKFIKKMEE